MNISLENKNAWSYTIIQYGYTYTDYLYLPAGIGMNFMMTNEVNKKAKFAAVTKLGSSDCEQTIIALKNANYYVIYDGEVFTILQNRDFRDNTE